jgi:hypothetical protein
VLRGLEYLRRAGVAPDDRLPTNRPVRKDAPTAALRLFRENENKDDDGD